MFFPNLSLGGPVAALALASCLALPAVPVGAADPAEASISDTADPAETLVASVDDAALRAYLRDVLERNPELQARRARARALEHRPDQVGALPDPMLQASLFALPPETRVGPQRLQVGVQQRLPSKLRRELRRDDAALAADAADAEVRAAELRLVTEARELWLELAFVDLWRDILLEERGHLERHEESARARYAAGTGLAQGPLKIQAELTRIDAEILDLDSRRRSLHARLDGLRDRFDEPVGAVSLPDLDAAEDFFDVGAAGDLGGAAERLLELALARRPEIRAAAVRQEQAEVGESLAETNRRPDVTVGLAWTLVEDRQDDAGRRNPPEDDGRDVLALTGGVTLPLWRTPREAELEEALARSHAAAAETRKAAAEIRRQIQDLVHRLPLDVRQLRLLRDVLEVQAGEAVTSVVSAYSAASTPGQTGALDLLDAEHRLFEVRRAVARARADLAIALAKLEGAVAVPLDRLLAPEEDHHD